MSETRGGRMIQWPEGARRSGLDHAIDRAIRQIMNVDARPAFRARVFARLERPAFHWFTASRMALAVTLGAMVLAFGLVRPVQEVLPTGNALRDTARPSAPQQGTDASMAAAKPAARSVLDSPPRRRDPAVSRPQQPSLGRRPGNVTQRVAVGAIVASVANEAPDLPADRLDTIAPIAVEPIASPAITPAPIVITPLAPITVIEIAPLAPRLGPD